MFNEYLAKQETEQRLTTHDTPQQDGVTKQLNWTLLEHVQAMLHSAHLPKGLWVEALMQAVWLRNQTSTKGFKWATPYEAFTGTKPNLADIHE